MYRMKGAIYKLKRSFTGSDDSDGIDNNKSKNKSKSKSKSGNGSTNWSSSNEDVNKSEDNLPMITLHGYSTKTKNRLINVEMCDEIRSLMPMRIQLYTDWTLLYSLEQHGASLHSLYKNIQPDINESNRRVGYVIIIQDRKNGIFGAYSNEPFRPNEHRRYSGNGECFLWKLEKVPVRKICNNKDKSVATEQKKERRFHGRRRKEDEQEEEKKGDNHSELCNNSNEQDEERWQFRGYPFTGLNEFAVYCTSKFISMGAGEGHYGLWIDDGLLNGVSNPTLTYGNEILSREGNKFSILGLEVWRVG
ncbi:Oxr1p NDAI_0F01690 [Naumovozyma dairenensis CBS 421]|uniref:Oxidation resistance protein 1 n=1 Tax=Naumovozyma dairenensis (strain ATCC 10597 / BCRC 20456 / CBS 421 / NBRC 0211 / NRRL Y-12639) TaxID=1071378 RepID=G0WCH7_NAUDC|nr:hypothetical protein NDAI_0F01690 [Naumovozyma dairenensis CBS 421]CCD25488.1 hypothetical protein NDAI_0F01690 [Naumovozyma dairenensis CBS 421]